MDKIVDIYMPLDSRDEPNAQVWPVAEHQREELIKAIKKCGWEPQILNPGGPVTSVAEGVEVIKKARGSRFINFLAGWAFPDFSVSPMWQLPKDVPKLMLGSAIPDFPGAVGLLAAASGTVHVGIGTDRLYVEHFDKHDTYIEQMEQFLKNGTYAPSLPPAIEVPVAPAHREKAKKVVQELKGSVYGAVGPRSMQMWNKISEADFLRYFGIAREGFDGLRLAKMAEKVPDRKAQKALEFLVEHGMDIQLGKDPVKHLTKDMVIFQMKVYFALLELKQEYGLDFLGVQDQLDWIDHYPATDLTLGLLNNRLRPETDGETVVAATEADDGAAITMQLFKLLNGGDPVGFNDFRYWDPAQGLYWFVNSGALAPYFAYGRHDSPDIHVLQKRRRNELGCGSYSGCYNLGPFFLPRSSTLSRSRPRSDRCSYRRTMAREVEKMQRGLAPLVYQAVRPCRMDHQFQPPHHCRGRLFGRVKSNSRRDGAPLRMRGPLHAGGTAVDDSPSFFNLEHIGDQPHGRNTDDAFGDVPLLIPHEFEVKFRSVRIGTDERHLLPFDGFQPDLGFPSRSSSQIPLFQCEDKNTLLSLDFEFIIADKLTQKLRVHLFFLPGKRYCGEHKQHRTQGRYHAVKPSFPHFLHKSLHALIFSIGAVPAGCRSTGRFLLNEFDLTRGFTRKGNLHPLARDIDRAFDRAF